MIGSGLFVFITTILGIVGICYKKKCLLCVYTFAIIVLMFVFIGMTICIPLILGPFVNGLKNSNCESLAQDSEFLEKLDEVYN